MTDEKTLHVQELEDAVSPLLDFFAEISVTGDILDKWERAKGDYNSLAEMNQDLNSIVAAELIDIAAIHDPEPNPKYKQAYVNWLKLNLLLFTTVPYWRSRLGHMMWYFVCAADQNAYFPLAWEDHFDPKEWYIVGEPQRAKDNIKVSAFSLPD